MLIYHLQAIDLSLSKQSHYEHERVNNNNMTNSDNNNNYDDNDIDNYDNINNDDDITTATITDEEFILEQKKLTSRLMYFIDNQIRVLKNDSSALLSALVHCSMIVENTVKILLNDNDNNKKEID